MKAVEQLMQPDGEPVAVGEVYMKVQYFQFGSMLPNGRRYVIHNIGVCDVITELGAVIPWKIGRKIKSKLTFLCHEQYPDLDLFAELLKSFVLTESDHENIMEKLYVGRNLAS